MRVILDRLVAGGDLLIFDGPPLQAVTDSAILSSVTDGTLLVVDVGRSRRGAVRQGREVLAKAGATVFGAVLNGIPARGRPDQADYYGGYYHSEEGAQKRAQETGPAPTGK
jgi:Mrp family chromosome partitioning ATPase